MFFAQRREESTRPKREDKNKTLYPIRPLQACLITVPARTKVEINVHKS